MTINKLLKVASQFNRVLKLAELENKYIAIGLTEDSRSLLLNSVPPKFGGKVGKKPTPGNIFADHITLEIQPSEELLEIFGEGERIPIHVIGECYDDKAQAVIVSLPDFFESFIRDKDRFPHITISTNKGVAPIYSNELIKAGTNYTELNNLLLQGKVKFITKK